LYQHYVNKLIHSQSISNIRKEQEIEQKQMPKKSFTQIGQELNNYSEQENEPELQNDSKQMHFRYRSMTKIGQDNEEIEGEEVKKHDQSMPIPLQYEEMRETGKPPLNQFNSFPLKNKKDSILKTQFQQSKKRKFTVRV
jgi:hypothetical protein